MKLGIVYINEKPFTVVPLSTLKLFTIRDGGNQQARHMRCHKRLNFIRSWWIMPLIGGEN